MFCVTMLVILFGEAILTTGSSPCVYQNIVKRFDVQPLGDGICDELSHDSEQDYKNGRDCDYPRDCRDVQQCGSKNSGVYRVYPYGLGSGFLVSCDMTTKGGGWLELEKVTLLKQVFQRRQDGSVDFYRNWRNYTDGFGNLYGEFWLGLEKIHLLTSQGKYKLLILLRGYDNSTGYAEYDKFFVSDAKENFRLMLGIFSGTVGDSLNYHNGMEFTTRDRDHDRQSTLNCAERHLGGWWYYSCHSSNLNGLYVNETGKYVNNTKSVCWHRWRWNYWPLQFTEMLLRPVESYKPAVFQWA